MFPTGEQGVGYAAGEFLNSMVDLASRPADAATRQVVLARAGDVADRFAAAGAQLDALQQRRDARTLQADVAQVNELAQQHRRAEPAHRRGAGPGPAAERPARPARPALAELSQKLQVSTVAADDGTLDGVHRRRPAPGAGHAGAAADGAGRPERRLARGAGPVRGRLVRLLQPQELGGGSIAGLLRFQNDDLVDARTQLGQLAAALAGKVNEQQALGLDLGDPPGSGAPIFAVGAARGAAQRQQRASTAPASSSARSA